LIGSFGLFVPFVHLVPYAIDHGVPQPTAVLLLGVIGVGSTAGRFFLGGLADRMGRRLALLATFIAMALAMILWASATGLWPLVAFALAYGVLYGGLVALLPALVMDYFGGRSVGAPPDSRSTGATATPRRSSAVCARTPSRPPSSPARRRRPA
jgi:MFS family permease